MGLPASSFIGEGKAQVTEEEKEKNQREKKASRVVESFFSFMWGPTDPVDVNQGWLHVVALFIIVAMCMRHLPVMAFHSVLTNIVMN